MGVVTQTVVIEQGARKFTGEEVERIREAVQWLPKLDRSELAATLCEHLGWYTASGTPKEQACLKLLEKLEAQGLLRLPPKRAQKVNAGKRRAVAVTERSRPGKPLEGRLRDFAPVMVEPVTDPEGIELWNEYVQRYHRLGYRQAFGYRLRYFIHSGSQPLGGLLLGGAAKSIGVRDKWIGWSARQRLRNLPWVLNNTRFLILPWVRIPHLASHVLGQLARRVVADWESCWGFSPVLMETFVDPREFAGTCYRAAGWEHLGQTTGEGLARPGKTYQTTPKLLFVKPLQPQFRQLLCSDALTGSRVE